MSSQVSGLAKCQSVRRFPNHLQYKPKFQFSNIFDSKPGISKATLGLLGANILIYGLYKYKNIEEETFQRDFTLSLEGVKEGNFHTLITYGFANTNQNQLICNLLGIGCYGLMFERYVGPLLICSQYFGGVLVGGLYFLYRQYMYETNQKFSGSNLGVASLVSGFNLPLLYMLYEKLTQQPLRISLMTKQVWLSIPLCVLNYYIYYSDQGTLDDNIKIGTSVFGTLTSSVQLFFMIMAAAFN